MKEDSFEPFDIRQLVQSLIPKTAKLIPGFVYSKLEKIIHLNEINTFCSEHYQDDEKTFLNAVVNDLLQFKVNYKGKDSDYLKTLTQSNVMIASNHPLGGPEAALMMNELLHKNKYRKSFSR